MPKIIAATNWAPQNITKWLLDRFNELGGLNSRKFIRNIEDLIKKLKDVSPGKRIVSFDVEVLFSSIQTIKRLYNPQERLMRKIPDP